MPAADLVTGKLLTAEEAAGVTDMPVYTIAGGGAFTMVADPAGVNWVTIIAVLTVLVRSPALSLTLTSLVLCVTNSQNWLISSC